MKTETTTVDTTIISTHWAEALGRQVAERRAERLAEQRAEDEAAGTRAQAPTAELARRFTATAVLVLEACDYFGQAAAIEIEADPPSPLGVQLKTPNNQLRLLRQDDALTVEFRGRSRAETRSFDLADEAFSAEAVARTIAETWIKQLEAEEGLRHVAR